MKRFKMFHYLVHQITKRNDFKFLNKYLSAGVYIVGPLDIFLKYKATLDICLSK